jgi:hypothetical protein
MVSIPLCFPSGWLHLLPASHSTSCPSQVRPLWAPGGRFHRRVENISRHLRMGTAGRGSTEGPSRFSSNPGLHGHAFCLSPADESARDGGEVHMVAHDSH